MEDCHLALDLLVHKENPLKHIILALLLNINIDIVKLIANENNKDFKKIQNLLKIVPQ